MLGEKVVNRRQFTQEEREKIKKKCQGKCACCGCNLSRDNYTVDHVIPIARGGTNDFDNLLPLCKKCNQYKADRFVWPEGYYMYARSTGALSPIMSYTDTWLEKYLTRDHVLEYPMVSSGISTLIVVKNGVTPRKGTIVPQLILDLFEITQDDFNAIREVTELTKKDVYDMQVYPDAYFSVYAMKRRTSDRYSALFSIQADPQYNTIFITNLWKDTTPAPIAAVVEYVVQQFHRTWIRKDIGYSYVTVRLLGRKEHDYIVRYDGYEFECKYCILPASDCELVTRGVETSEIRDLRRRLEMFGDNTLTFGFMSAAVADNIDFVNSMKEKLRTNRT